MSLHDRTADLVRSIHSAVDGRAAWPEVFAAINAHVGSPMMLVSVVDVRAGHYDRAQWYGPGVERAEQGLREYGQEMFRRDPTLAFGIANPHAGRVSLRRELVRQGRDPAGDPYVRWVRDRLGIDDTMVRYTSPACGFILGMSVHASAAEECLSREGLERFALLFGHVEGAMRLMIRPPDFTGDVGAVMMIARDGGIVRASPAAERLLAAADGLARAGGRLVAASSAHDRRLDAAIRTALRAAEDGGSGTALALPRPSGRRALLVRVDPMPSPPAPFQAFGPAALVAVTEPDAADIPADAPRRWIALFGLTPAEARLAAAVLAQDAPLRLVADRLGIAYATARAQLNGVFVKIGVNSRAQMARLLTRIGGIALALLGAAGQTVSGGIA